MLREWWRRSPTVLRVAFLLYLVTFAALSAANFGLGSRRLATAAFGVAAMIVGGLLALDLAHSTDPMVWFSRAMRDRRGALGGIGRASRPWTRARLRLFSLAMGLFGLLLVILASLDVGLRRR